MIQPQDDVQYFTVMPDPDRSFIQRQIVADVLVVQGTDAERYAGLLTVYRQDAQGFLRPNAVAISLPDEVSGIGLAAAADISHLCNSNNCNFYFGWQQIPYSFVPAHYMMDGHGFSVHITPRPQQAAAGSGEQGPNPAQASDAVMNSHSNSESDQEARNSADHQSDWGRDSEHATATPIPGSPSQFEHWQGVQIYRLNRPVVHCFVRWGTYNSILYDIARFLREQLRNIIGIHNVQAVLAGQHEAEDSVILQHVQDLATGSTEQLVILDTEVHFQTAQQGMLNAPEVSRRVHRITSQISRPYVLRLARLSNYCFLQGDRCLVYLNNELWAEQDNRVRTMQHGCYLKVVATPPLDQTVPTEVALNFAITIDDMEAGSLGECTSAPRSRTSLALVQRQAQCLSGFDQDHNPLHLHVHRFPIDVTAQMDMDSRWFDTLSNHFSMHAMVECTEEGSIAYATTWYVNHQNAKRCEISRSVRLIGSAMSTWHQQITDSWSDQIDPSTPLRISVVWPHPPKTETESNLAHYFGASVF